MLKLYFSCLRSLRIDYSSKNGWEIAYLVAQARARWNRSETEPGDGGLIRVDLRRNVSIFANPFGGFCRLSA